MERGSAIDVAEIDVDTGVQDLLDSVQVALAGEVHEADVGANLGRDVRSVKDLRSQGLVAILPGGERGLPAECEPPGGLGFHCWTRRDVGRGGGGGGGRNRITRV